MAWSKAEDAGGLTSAKDGNYGFEKSCYGFEMMI